MRISLASIWGAWALVGMLVGLNLAWHNRSIIDQVPDVVAPGSEVVQTIRTVPYVDATRLDLAFEQAMISVERLEPVDDAQVVIIPHHLVAADMIAEALLRVAHRRIDRILLISPDHFSVGKSPLIVSRFDWKTSQGLMSADQSFIDDMVAEQALIGVDEDPFEREHGIYGVIPYVQTAFPQAQVVPILVKDRLPLEEAEAFGAWLASVADSRTLVVGSFDFSHEQIDLSAQFHDRTSVDALQSVDVASFASLDIDSRPGLAIVAGFAKAKQAMAFQLFEQYNSTDYVGNPDQMDVTSNITGAYVPGDAKRSETTTLLAFGDMMLNREIGATLKRQGNDWSFAPIRRFIAGTDLTVANLEGTITDEPSITSVTGELRFTFDPSVASTLAQLGFDGMSLANNHSRDFGYEGYVETQQRLSDVGIEHFGDLFNRESLSWIAEVRGRRLGFVGAHTVYGRDASVAVDEVKRLRSQVDTIIVYAHWGDEYQKQPTKSQRDLAHTFIDAGADIVLGSHPHVVQPLEVYEGGLIVYSMGNFVFDQLFSTEVQQGLAVGLAIQDSAIEVYVFPHIISNGYQVHLMKPSISTTFYTNLSQTSTASDSVKADMLDGHFTLLRL